MSRKQPVFVQALNVIFNGIPAAAGGFGSNVNGYSAMLAGDLQYLRG